MTNKIILKKLNENYVFYLTKSFILMISTGISCEEYNLGLRSYRRYSWNWKNHQQLNCILVMEI